MKQKTGRKLLSFLLTLAMVVGLMPGMGLTAYAASDTVVTFAASDLILNSENNRYESKKNNVVLSSITRVQVELV